MKIINKRFRFLFLLLMINLSNGFSQVNDIVEELEKDKKEKSRHSSNSNSSSSYNSNSSNDPDRSDGLASNLIGGLFSLIGQGIGYAQRETLQSRKEHPGVVSLEAFLNGGYYPRYQGVLVAPRIRLNWGIVSSEFRNQRIFDGLGLLDTYDWQIIKLNIPIYPVKLSMGMGFTKVPDVSLSYFEASFNGQVQFFKKKALAEIEYRATEKNNSRWFRRELKTTFEYEVKHYSFDRMGKIGICPMVGFVYQNYFARIDQYYFMGGINFRWY